MTIPTVGISDDEFKDHLRLLRQLQRQAPSNATRLILENGDVVDGLITGIGGNFLEIETLLGTSRIQHFGEVTKIEYPAGNIE